MDNPFENVGDDAHIVPAVLGVVHRCSGANAYHERGGGKPPPYGVLLTGQCVVCGAYQRRDT